MKKKIRRRRCKNCDDLFKLGIIDSFGYVQLIRFLEDEFQFQFSEEEMLSNLLVSFESIVEPF